MAAVLLRRSIALAGLATVATLASPLVGTALAVDPALTPGTFTPSNGSTVAANRPAISAAYNTALNTSSTTIAVTDTSASNAAVSCARTFSNSNKTVGCTLAADLTDGHTYKVAVHAVNADSSSHRDDSATWTIDIPSLVKATPADGTAVAKTTTSIAVFDEQIDVNHSNVTVRNSNNNVVPGSFTVTNPGSQNDPTMPNGTITFTASQSGGFPSGSYTASFHAQGVNGSGPTATNNPAAFANVAIHFTVDKSLPPAGPANIVAPANINSNNVTAVPFSGVAAPGFKVAVAIYDESCDQNCDQVGGPSKEGKGFQDGLGTVSVAQCSDAQAFTIGGVRMCPWSLTVNDSAGCDTGNNESTGCAGGDPDAMATAVNQWYAYTFSAAGQVPAKACPTTGTGCPSADPHILRDTTPPQSPSGATGDINGNTLTVSATDSSSDVDHYVVKATDGIGQSVSKNFNPANDGNETLNGNVDISSIADGTETVTIAAVDQVGNASSASTASNGGSLIKETVQTATAAPSNDTMTINGADSSFDAVASGPPVHSPEKITVIFNEPLRLGVSDSSGANAGNPQPLYTSEICLTDSSDLCVNDGLGTTTLTSNHEGLVWTAPNGFLPSDGVYTVTAFGVAATCSDKTNLNSSGYTCERSSPDPGNTLTTFTIDDTPPAAPTVTTPSGVIDANHADQFPISGTAEVGSTVTGTIKSSGGGATLLLNGGQPISVDSNGHWQDQENLSSMNDGTLTVSAFATDGAGNKSAAGHPSPEPTLRAHPKFTTQLTAKTHAKAVTFGKSLRLTGRLVRKTSQSGLVGARLKITPVFDSGAKGKAIVIHTGNFGNWSKRLHPSRNAYYVVTFAGDAQDGTARAHTARTVVRVNIHFTSPKNGSTVGSPVTLKGAVGPNKAGKLVSIYRHTSSGNTLVGTAKLTSASTFTFKMTLPPGTTQVFARIGKTKNNAGNRSGLLTLHH